MRSRRARLRGAPDVSIPVGQVEQYVAAKGWRVVRVERTGGQPNMILDCPLCGAKSDSEHRRFWIVLGNDKDTRWKCNDCGEKGNLYLLKKALGDVAEVSGGGYRAPSSSAGVGLVDLSGAVPGRDPKVAAALADPAMTAPVAKKRGPIEDGEAKVGAMALALQSDPTTLALLRTRRGFDAPELAALRFGLRLYQERRWLAIPYFEKGVPVLIKYRSLDGRKEFRRFPADGRPAPLWNLDTLEGHDARVYLTEGEIDAATLEVVYGKVPAVSLPDGAKKLTDEHAAALERFDEIVIVTDNDEKGELSAKAIADRLGGFRCSRVKLPRKDANECHAGRPANPEKGEPAVAPAPREEVEAAFAAARAMGDIQVLHIADILERAFGPTSETFDVGLSTGLSDLDRVIGGFRRKEWTAVSGPSGAGKTQLQLQFNLAMAVGGWPLLQACIELEPEKVAIRQCAQVVRRPMHGLPAAERSWAIGELRKLPIYTIDYKGTIPMDRLVNAAEFAVRRYGIRGFSVDHLNFAVKNPNDYDECDAAVIAFDKAVTRLNVHGILGAHPKKVETDPRSGMPRPVGINDIRGSAQISQLSHNVVIVRRCTKKADRDAGKGIVAVEKKRWEGSSVPIPALVPVMWNKQAGMYVDDEAPAEVSDSGGDDDEGTMGF